MSAMIRRHYSLYRFKNLITYTRHTANESESDYSIILISNRDEFYDRPAQCMSPWSEDFTVYGGKDLQSGCEGGTWLAVSPTRKKLGLLLNLPGLKQENAKSRGNIVADYIKSKMDVAEYVEYVHNYSKECNEFLLVAVEFGNSTPKLQTYSNATGIINQWTDTYLGFSNSLPDTPLKKVEGGKNKLIDICTRLNKITDKAQLVDELTSLLKSNESYLPDPILQERQPNLYKEFSSIYVHIPEVRYGTRAHTIMLMTKSGNVDLIEISMKSPINAEKPHWEQSKFQFYK